MSVQTTTALHSPTSLLASRVAALVRQFEHIAVTRMAGLPVLNPALQVQAVGFATEPDQPAMALGVLVTPWFMNLIRLPLADTVLDLLPAPGCDAPLQLGAQQLDVIGAHEDVIGRYALCSLFSPMADFADQAGAVATALAVLDLLRPTADAPPRPGQPAPAAAALAAPAAATSSAPTAPAPSAALAAAPQQPARRGFLFGRLAGAAPR